MYTSPAYLSIPAQQYPGPPAQQFPFAAPADPDNGWVGWSQPQPLYAPMPIYGPPDFVYLPPPYFEQPSLEQQQQPMSQYQVATPVLYSSTSTAFTPGLPRNAQTISALAGGGIVVSSLGLEYNGESTREESGAFEDYGELMLSG